MVNARWRVLREPLPTLLAARVGSTPGCSLRVSALSVRAQRGLNSYVVVFMILSVPELPRTGTSGNVVLSVCSPAGGVYAPEVCLDYPSSQ